MRWVGHGSHPLFLGPTGFSAQQPVCLSCRRATAQQACLSRMSVLATPRQPSPRWHIANNAPPPPHTHAVQAIRLLLLLLLLLRVGPCASPFWPLPPPPRPPSFPDPRRLVAPRPTAPAAPGMRCGGGGRKGSVHGRLPQRLDRQCGDVPLLCEVRRDQMEPGPTQGAAGSY